MNNGIYVRNLENISGICPIKLNAITVIKFFPQTKIFPFVL